MREWDEITRDLLRRRDEKIARKKAQLRVVKRTALSALCLCVTVAAGAGIWKNMPERTKNADSHNEPTTVTDEPTSDGNVSPSVTSSVNSVAATTQEKQDIVTTAAVKTTSARTTLTAASVSAQRTTAANPSALTNRHENIVTTDIDVLPNEPQFDSERNVVMRKFLAVLAATSAMANPILANASPIVRFDPKEDYMYSATLNYSKIESGELDPDFNGDGKFDIFDARDAYAAKNPDMNTIYNYYLLNNGIVPEDFDAYKYKDENGRVSDDSWRFIDWISSMPQPNLKYDYAVKYDRENNVSLDFNEDGVVDYKDCLDYWMFDNYLVGYVLWNLDFDIRDEFAEKYGVDPDNRGWAIEHRLDSILGTESEDIGFCIPADMFYQDFPMKESTLKNCAKYYREHRYIGHDFDAGSVLVTKEIINNYDFTEEWLDPDKCYEYLISNADEKYLDNIRFRECVACISGHDEKFTNSKGEFFERIKYEYDYMGEARVDAIEAGLVKYEDYCDILSWHSNNQNYMSATYPVYEKAVREGRTAAPDMNADGKLDDLDMEILSACYRVITVKEYTTDEVVETVKRWYDPTMFSRANNGRYNVNFDRPDWNPDGDAIASLDCNENGIICDDYDVLFAGIYISKYGTVDFDLYSEFFASELYTQFENRDWRYYDRNSGFFHDMPYGVYYDYIVSLGDLLFDMDKANKTEPKTPKAAPYRTGDATADGDVKMNDVVLIMQTLCNPNKYSLSIRGEFNADVNNTNDGITPMDALAVQRRLLNLC
ncbi:hypothetical protein [Ruminococcus flavefaciens]|uniref:hypothetical protein n=1 Tax=Ruminococcus flavefaciens TaxID=1265 RepID=UPI0026EC2F5E|nr:hypothetical protein [Ruminococcus flavefaciens]